MSSYPSNEPIDNELTDPEIRQLVHRIVCQRILAYSDADLLGWQERKIASEKIAQRHDRESFPIEKPPFPPYDSDAALSKVYESLEKRALEEVLRNRVLSIPPLVRQERK